MKLPGNNVRRTVSGALAALVLCAAICFFALWQLTDNPLPAVLARPESPVLLDNKGNLIHARLSPVDEWRLPVPLEDMGLWLPKVLVAVEDKRFYGHPGIDLLALGRALFQNLASGRVVSGASTLSSQLVRLGTPRPRTLWAKVQEFMGALKLERSLSKREILEHYLNNAPFGGPIRGAEAAARLYFGKRAKELSLGEAALLVGLLKGPTAYRPDKNPQAALRRRQQIIEKVAGQTAFPPDLTALALAEPLPRYRSSMPNKARHFADLAFKTLPKRGGIVPGSLDMDLQAKLHDALNERLAFAGPEVTAAGVIVENASGAVLAYVGNARFDGKNDAHWVDCAIAPRSPGSTLKPFVYLAALEAGRIIPATLLADTPLQLGGEAPRNFDRRYRGPVSARTALSASLNTPAVRVLRAVGVRPALALLRKADFKHLNRDDADYGDSLVLGAGEITLLELARAYVCLARLGEDSGLVLRRPLPGAYPAAPGAALPSGLAPMPVQLDPQRARPGRRLYSAEAAFLIADILKDTDRLPFLVQLTRSMRHSPAAFKTGTSFGLRDAWTAAYTPDHTVVVWFGKEPGGADERLTGLGLAAPAAMQALRGVTSSRGSDSRGTDSRWYAPPKGVDRVRVCALSGAAPSPFCPTLKTDWNIPAVWPTRPCALHVLRQGKTALEWPPELEDFNRKRFAAQDLSRTALIISPLPGARYLITPGSRRQPVALMAEGVDYPVHWYANGEYLGRQERADKPLYWLPVHGEHRVSLLDAKERVGGTLVQVTDLALQTPDDLLLPEDVSVP